MPDKGVACHWTVNAPPADHAGCVALVDQIAQLHAAKGSTGHTFYNWVFCNHGARIRGRGWDRQSGANGTSQANRDYWACAWIGGPGHVPSQGAFAVLAGLIVEAPGASVARPHSDFYATACPGPDITAFTRSWTGEPASAPPISPTLTEAPVFLFTIDNVTWYLGAIGGGVRQFDKGRAAFSTATKLVVDQAEFDFIVKACQPSGVVATLKALWPGKAARAGL